VSTYDRAVVLSRRLRLALLAVEAVGAATLFRSIAYDRWITVLASVLLITGAIAAQRSRVWGIGLAFGAAVAFPVAWAIGIAPMWFCLVGLAGALPFALTLRAFMRFDRGATALLATLAASAGALGAIAWKEYALTTFAMFPSLLPSIEPQHGVTLATLAVLGAVVSRARLREGADEGVRIASRIRVGADESRSDAAARMDAVEAEALEVDAPPRARRSARSS
jgi:hypothetical protein